MCRWLVWTSSEPILLSDVVFEPSNSLVHQSFNGGFHPGLCPKNNMTLNADGFGIGWYSPCRKCGKFCCTSSSAAIFRSVTPAWNNRNLRELCGSVESTCIFAHVRAASPSSVVSEENCHPFRYGPLLFQHNGHVEGFGRIKRRLMAELRDDIYAWVEGTTDSEACFALVLSLIDAPLLASCRRVPAAAMRRAMLGAIALLRQFIVDENITEGFSTFNFALTDGHTVVVTRYCDKAPRIPPPSLYYAFSSCAKLRSHLTRNDQCCRRTPGDGSAAAQPPPSSLAADAAAAAPPPPAADAAASDAPSAASLSAAAGVMLTERCTGGAFMCASEPLTHHVGEESEWHLIEEVGINL